MSSSPGYRVTESNTGINSHFMTYIAAYEEIVSKWINVKQHSDRQHGVINISDISLIHLSDWTNTMVLCVLHQNTMNH